MEPFSTGQTLRQSIIALLEAEELTIRDLSQSVGLPEKEIIVHLGHIERTLQQRGRKLAVKPYSCLACGFVFEDRGRFTKPGKCPQCRGTRIQVAHFRII